MDNKFAVAKHFLVSRFATWHALNPLPGKLTSFAICRKSTAPWSPFRRLYHVSLGFFDKNVTHHLFGGELVEPYTSLGHDAKREILRSRSRDQVINVSAARSCHISLHRCFLWITSTSLSHRLPKQEAKESSEGDSSEEPDAAENGNRTRTARDQRPKPDWYKSSCQLYALLPHTAPSSLKRRLHLTGSFTMIETWILDHLGG